MGEMLSHSQVDSKRFGMTILRGKCTDAKPRQLAQEIYASHCDIAILRVPSESKSALSGLARFALPVLHCDTLVYYSVDLGKFDPKPLRNADLDIREATPADRDALSGLIQHTFVGYRSHYSNNPLLDPASILDGYQEWGEGFLEQSEGKLWIALRHGEPIAFAACRESTEEGIGEGVLYGVSPQAAGGGIYGDLIRHTQADFKRRGFRTMLVSTQVDNFAVQKVWSREGFSLTQAWDTFHINALLSAGETGYEGNVHFTQEQVDAFSRVSGDANPLHVDAAFARASGFPATIAHGVMGAAEISRVLGTVCPGEGTVLTHLGVVFLRPVFTGRDYTLSVRFINGLKASGPMHVVSQVRDEQGQPCLVARSDITLKR